MARYLVTVDDHTVFAYASAGHDYYRASDDVLWAHESQDRLLAARSGTTLARRIGLIYYDADSNAPLYYQES
jgi:hypothetical protein